MLDKVLKCEYTPIKFNSLERSERNSRGRRKKQNWDVPITIYFYRKCFRKNYSTFILSEVHIDRSYQTTLGYLRGLKPNKY
jgi:hypothetical protein